RTQAAGWEARLALRFAREPARTVLAGRRHTGPLRVQKALYPEGPDVCQVIVVHPPGGIVGGDLLDIAVTADPGAHAQLTTPGAAKWYRSGGSEARQCTRLNAGEGATIEWLPQETLLYDGARASISTRIELAAGARYIGWDVTTLGRTASGERFASGKLHQTFELVRDGALAWCERTVLDGGSRALRSGAILGGAPVFGTMIAAGGIGDNGLLAACRAVVCVSGEGAVTRLPKVIVARYRGESAVAARTYFALLWRVLRPALAGREAVPPRIWST
ncbi:MAG: urease accessory protein UreD, partial [Aromatoleum sp.]|nr:urease accessory protein UreD [Aromatoleum sp.]